MDISVIICTYNRAGSLRRTLEACCALVVPADLRWELLIMDNNSTDATKQVCEAFTGKLPLRYFFEKRQGKSYALNRALNEAHGDLLLFTDDDVAVDSNWLIAYREAAIRHPTAAFFGGKVIPRWEATPPRWVLDNYKSPIVNCISLYYDLGEDERLVVDGNDMLFPGANMAIRRSCLTEDIRFRVDICPTDKEKLAYEETELHRQIIARGGRGLYVPAAFVHHCNDAHRMTEKHLRRCGKGSGISEVRVGEIKMCKLFWGVPLYYWKQLILQTLLYGVTRWTAPSRIWLSAEWGMANAWGVVYELRRQRRRANG